MKTEEKIICNCCRKVIAERDAIPMADYLHVEKEQFDLCEECYDAWIKSLQIPVASREVTELV